MRNYNLGWRGESERHSLSARGIKTVDLKRYSGKWYNPAFIPTVFQGKDCKKVFAKYKVVGSNDVRVQNVCDNRSIDGKARSKSDDNRTLEVSFFPFIWSDYIIEYVDKDYQYAVVGSTSKDYLWFLSRKENIPKRKLEELKKLAKSKGYDVSKVYEP